jgi:SAM-dependent methyltransferase
MPKTGDAEQAMRRFGLGDEDVAAWQDSGLPEDAFTGWLPDRVARRPSGRRAREVYGAEDVHDFARRAILDALALAAGPGDHVLEVGCGGGLLLRDAQATGARVTGIDYSAEMTRLARQRAPGAGVVCASAENLPFAGNTFSALAMSVVFFFLAAPVRVLRERRRVLRSGAPAAIYTTGPELRETPQPRSRWPVSATSTPTSSSPRWRASRGCRMSRSAMTAAARCSPPAPSVTPGPTAEGGRARRRGRGVPGSARRR